MGKRSKRGASLRAKKRANVAHQQLEQAQTERGEQDRVQSKADTELFVLDTDRKETHASAGAAAARRTAAEEKEASRKRKREFSEREKRHIRRVLETHGKEGAIALAERGRKRLDEGRLQKKRLAGSVSKPTFDLWDAPPPAVSAGRAGKRQSKTGTLPVDGFEPPTQPAAKLSNKQIKSRKQAQAEAPPKMAVEVAHPGQSYRPDREHHQDAIGEALSIEIRRNEAEEYKAKPISEGMSDFTKGFIVESSEDESSDDEDDDESNANATAKIIKRKEKLTRAKRNKQKRVRAEQHELKERRKHKQFLHQANEAHMHKKSVKHEEEVQRQRQKEISKLKSEKKSRPLGKDVWNSLSQKDPIRAPSLPVALTEELQGEDGNGKGGGLRTVAPKGSLVTDRLESMAARGMMNKKGAGGRRIVQGKKRSRVRGEKGTQYLLI